MTYRAAFPDRHNSRTVRTYPSPDEEMCRLIRDGILLIDTWALLVVEDNAVLESRRRQETFLETVANACIKTNAPIWTSILTWNKLNDLSANGSESEAYAANYALNFLQFLDERRLLNTVNKMTTGGSEIEQLCEQFASTSNCPPICVVTLNSKLAQSLRTLGSSLHASISAYRVNMGGRLSVFAPGIVDPVRKPVVPPVNNGPTVPGETPVIPVNSLHLSNLSTEPRPITEAPVEGTTLYGRSRIPYKLGAPLSAGGEATVFGVDGNEDIVIKVYKQFTSEAQEHKIALLSSLKIPGCVLPRDRVYTADGTFCGYMMERVKGVTLTQTFDPEWRKEREENFLFEQLFAWNRADYVHAAMKLISIEIELMKKGVYVADSRLDNVMVGHDVDGFLSADHLMLIDLDSAQVNTELLSGGREHGWIAAGGITPDMSAPEIIRNLPFTTDTIIDDRAMGFQMALQAFTVLQVGIHPYQAVRDLDHDYDRSLRGAVAAGEFPYGVHGSTSMTSLRAPAQSAYLLSYLPGQLKKLLHSVFSYGGKFFGADNREGLGDELLTQLRYADTYFRNTKTLRLFKEMLSLTPSCTKPFLHACTDPHCTTPHEQKLLVYKSSDMTAETVIKTAADTFLCRGCYARRYPQAALG